MLRNHTQVDENKISIIRQKCDPDGRTLSSVTVEFNEKWARILPVLLEFVEDPRGCDNYTVSTNFSKVFCIVLYRKFLVAGWFSDQGILSYAYEQDLLHNNNESFRAVLASNAAVMEGLGLHGFVAPQ